MTGTVAPRRAMAGGLLAAACWLALAIAPAGASAAGSCTGTASPTATGAEVAVTCDFGTRSFQLFSSREVTGSTGFAGFDCAPQTVDQPGSPYSSQLSCRMPRRPPSEGGSQRVQPGEPITGTISFAGGPGCDGAGPVALSFYSTELLDDVEYEGEVVFDVCAAGGAGEPEPSEPAALPARDSTVSASSSSALVRVTCRADESCRRVRVAIRTRGRGSRATLLGAATVTVRAGRTQRVRVKLTKSGKRALRRSRSGRVKARLAVTFDGRTAARNVTLRARR